MEHTRWDSIAEKEVALMCLNAPFPNLPPAAPHPAHPAPKPRLHCDTTTAWNEVTITHPEG